MCVRVEDQNLFIKVEEALFRGSRTNPKPQNVQLMLFDPVPFTSKR